MQKEKIRPLYGQLKGYLSQAPAQNQYNTDNSTLWESFNNVIDRLNEHTEAGKYDSFRIKPISHPGGEGMLYYTDIPISTYRSNLAGLISNLHAEYFCDEVEPFTGAPGTVINQSQVQQQSQSVQVAVLQIQEKIIEKLSDKTLKENERGFLAKLKELLPTITSVFQLITTIIKLAKDFGLDTASLLALLSS